MSNSLHFATIPRASAGDTITAIEVSGNRTVAVEAIRSRLLFAVGDAYDPAKVDRSIKAVFATGLFSDVRINKRGTIAIITVVENPIISRVSFEGNSKIDKAKLAQEVQLKARARFTPAKAHADALRLRDLYRRQGRLATTVDPKTTEKSDGNVELVFVIKEGEVTKIDSISFTGNRSFPESNLRDVISTSQSGWFDILKTAAFYDPERLTHDKELLRLYYLNHGFPDARVVAAEAVETEAKTGYKIAFTIEEGERFTFGTADIESALPAIGVADLRELLRINPGDYYNEELVEKSVEKLTITLSERGSVFTQVHPIPKRDVAAHKISLTFRIEDAPHIFIERIDIVGNKKTNHSVIRRAFRIAEGDAVNAILLERARSRVQGLGFFESVKLKHTSGSAQDRVVIEIDVVEKETLEVSFGVGYSTSQGVVGDISLSDNNLFGEGQSLRIKLSGSLSQLIGTNASSTLGTSPTLEAAIGFTEPHLLDSNVAGGFDLFYKDVDATAQSSYKSLRIGGDLRLSYPISENWSAGVNYTLSRNELYDVGANASDAIKEAVPGFPNETSSTYYTSSIGFSVKYDGRDNKKVPTSGVYFTMAQDFAGVGGDAQYIRTVGEIRGYYPITDDITLFGRATGGVITGWGGQDVRLLDLFYIGGETVRGFAPAGIGPRDLLSANQDALGGKMYYALTAETLFQIPGVPKDVGLRGEVFADAGSLWNTNSTAAALPGIAGNSAALRASAGVGLVWDSPLGALQVDYAVPVAKQPFDKTQPLGFGLLPQ
jgi:outer membrane protein insertion porin family